MQNKPDLPRYEHITVRIYRQKTHDQTTAHINTVLAEYADYKIVAVDTSQSGDGWRFFLTKEL